MSHEPPERIKMLDPEGEYIHIRPDTKYQGQWFPSVGVKSDDGESPVEFARKIERAYNAYDALLAACRAMHECFTWNAVLSAYTCPHCGSIFNRAINEATHQSACPVVLAREALAQIGESS